MADSKQEKTIKTAGGEKLYEGAATEKDVEELYKHSNILSQAQDPTKHEDSYVAILNAVKGSTKAKVLASQFIPMYLKHFPKLAARAINFQLDLCEEELIDVRVHAIKGLPLICKDNPEQVSSIASVVAQLLLATDEDENTEKKQSIELDTIRRSFLSLLKIDAKTSLNLLFQQLKQKSAGDEDDKSREAALLFIRDKVIPEITFTPEIENMVAENLRTVVKDASEKEFNIVLEVLQKLSSFTTPEGHKKLLEIVTEKAGVEDLENFKTVDAETIKRILTFVNIALPIYNAEKKVGSSTAFVKFFIEKVLPQFMSFEDKIRLLSLHAIASLSPYTSASDARAFVPKIYALMYSFLPTPPAEGKADPEINFSYIECLLYTFHQLAQKAPGALNSICGIRIITGQVEDSDMKEHPELKKEFQSRLEYLLKKSKEYQSIIQKAKKELGGTTEEQQQREKQIQFRTALMNNIIRMVSPLARAKVSLDSFLKPHTVQPSWVKKPAQQSQQTGKKREAETTTTSAEKPGKKRRFENYVPPARREGAAATSSKPQQNEKPATEQNNGGNGGRKRRGGGGRRGGRGNKTTIKREL